MPAYPRAELEEMVERWLEVNRMGEAKKDWQHMAELYTEDATYGWNVGPGDEFAIEGLARQRNLAAQFVEMLLHRAQLRFACRFWVPSHQCLDTGLHRLIHFHTEHVLHEFQHGETSFGCIKRESWPPR